MNIKIDQELIAEAIARNTAKAVDNAMAAYDLQAAISKVVADGISHGAITEAVMKAIEEMNTAEITAALAVELQRSTIKAVVAVLQDGMTNTVARIRGIPDYTEEGKADRRKLKIELFKD